MRHFIEQFGPCLSWPWTKLMDVPELTDELIDQIADQSDAQSGALSIRQLERLRDNNLVAIMRALKGQDAAAGALLNAHQKGMAAPVKAADGPITTIRRVIPIDWTDYNGHMNESRYGQVFSDAGDEIMKLVGADADYIAGGNSYFTVDNHIQFKQEALPGQRITVDSIVTEGRGKKLRMYHRIKAEDGSVICTCDQLLIHVSLETRRACEPAASVAEKAAALAASHAGLRPEEAR